MTQSAASQSVQHLEDFLSVQLIDRTKRPFVLTAEGQKFYDGLAGVLRQFDSLVDEVRLGGSTSGEEVTGHVVVASIYSIGLCYLPVAEARVGRAIEVVIRSQAVAAVTVETPFYKRAK